MTANKQYGVNSSIGTASAGRCDIHSGEPERFCREDSMCDDPQCSRGFYGLQYMRPCRPYDNTLFRWMIEQAQHSIDLLVITGRQTLENQERVIRFALERDVKVRLLLLDPYSSSAQIVQDRFFAEKPGKIAAEFHNTYAILKRITVQISNAPNLLECWTYDQLPVLRTMQIDRRFVWYFPLLPFWEESIPSLMFDRRVSGKCRLFTEIDSHFTALVSGAAQRLDLHEDASQLRRPEDHKELAIEQLNRVFVVHGHDEERLSDVELFLTKVGLEPIILKHMPGGGNTIIEGLEKHSDVSFAVVLLTADDTGGLAKANTDTYEPRARQNVIFELGYMIAKLGRRNVCALKKGDVEIPTDFGGVLYIKMDSAGAWKMAVAKELRESGLKVDLNDY